VCTCARAFAIAAASLEETVAFIVPLSHSIASNYVPASLPQGGDVAHDDYESELGAAFTGLLFDVTRSCHDAIAAVNTVHLAAQYTKAFTEW
jgi:hypothetical protein